MSKKVLLVSLKNKIDEIKNLLKADEIISVAWDENWDVNLLAQTAIKSYEYIVIAIDNNELYEKISDLLINGCKADTSRIVNYYLCLETLMPKMKVDRTMILGGSYEGIMLGISNAEHGFIQERMNIPFCNLAIASQDLFFNYQTLKYCFDNFPEQFENLRYVFIDMFDYTYLNFDTSLASVGGVYFWENGGFFLDRHHFDENKNYTFNYDEMIAQMSKNLKEKMNAANIDAFRDIFDEAEIVYKICAYDRSIEGRGIANRISHYEYDEATEKRAFGNGLIDKVHNDTINENVNNLNLILKLIYEKNPETKVVLMLMPQEADANAHQKEKLKMWKSIFEETIETMKGLYPIEYLDMKDSEISKNPYYFEDFGHLNYYGAMVFTDKLNEIMGEL